MCGTGCRASNETERDQSCIDCSHQIAKRDLVAMDTYKANITIAADEKCFPASLLAAFISRQTQGGVELDGSDGWIKCHGSDKECFGLMHTPKYFGPSEAHSPITSDGIGGINYLKQGIDEIIRLIDKNVEQWKWTDDLLTRAGIASWDAIGGLNTIPSHDFIDLYTMNQDFSSDILARAQFFAENGY